VGEFAGGGGVGEEAVDEVGEHDGPEEGNGAEEEEEGKEADDAEAVEEDHEGLEAALEGDVEGGPADARVRCVRNCVEVGKAELTLRCANLRLLVYRSLVRLSSPSLL